MPEMASGLRGARGPGDVEDVGDLGQRRQGLGDGSGVGEVDVHVETWAERKPELWAACTMNRMAARKTCTRNLNNLEENKNSHTCNGLNQSSPIF